MALGKFLLLVVAATAMAAPSKMKDAEDMMAEEGRHVPAYAAPAPYAAASAPRYGSVTSYNRRGSYASAGDLAKPSIYGSSYGAAPAGPAYNPAPAYSPYNNAPKYAPELSGPYHGQPAYGSSYGPQRNEYSAQSQQLSHDPNYDPAKDPVSQYAEYIPVREYTGKQHSIGNELSIYGYKK
ncbi:adhesive plaque matrix protein-like [Uloborus diversus]|uniref:adhesive plaque matrix protein-like n=1 Tax=Uloborus diversus TaxID=327109 RepID=UPI002409B43A|nr:adhesive plaque matrix protein-like [Uloborus diversus]